MRSYRLNGEVYMTAPDRRAFMAATAARCWLASDRSTFINGEDVIVDGGLVRGRLFTPQQTGLRQVKSMLGLDD
jgi:hypothetical protein